MKTYNTLLTESNVKKLKHLTHLPEAILHLGFEGARESIELLRTLRDSLKNGSDDNTLSVKLDGAPALIFGYDPSDGKFFCGTKGVFAKTPKLVKTKEDLDTFGYSGELRKKLELSLEHMPKIVDKGIYQGDMMFTSGDLKNETIDGEKLVTFTPNTITYAVPAGSDLAKEMKRAKIGIVLHTTYIGGPDFDNMTAQPGVVDISNFKKTPDVWYDDPYVTNLSGKVTLSSSETVEVHKHLAQAGKVFQSMSKPEIDGLLKTFDSVPSSLGGAKLETFINGMVRANRLPKPGQGRKLAKEYAEYIDTYFDEKVLPKLKSAAGKEKKIREKEDLKKRVDFTAVAKVMDFMASVNEAMMILLNKLNTGYSSMKTFVADGEGFRVTSGEGYVITSKLSGNTWKIVDRAEFSRLNFLNSLAKFGSRTK